MVFEVCLLASNYPGEGLSASDDGGERARLPFRTSGAAHPAHTEARAELRDRETYYEELRLAVQRQSRLSTRQGHPDTWTGADESSRDDNRARDEMATRFGDTWT
jgi:hypothetical protein